MSLLYLSHALLAVFCLLGASLEEGRSRLVIAAGSAGTLCGLGLFFMRHSDSAWRTTDPEPGPVAAAGLAAACAWLLVVVMDRGRGNWQAGALTGVAACGLILFATNRWIVPALLFWAASSVALAACARGMPGRAQFWLQLSLADLLLFGALVGHAIVEETWRLPPSARGSTFWLVAAAAIIRSGLLARVGGWNLTDTAPHSLPLAAGGSFVLLTGIGDNEEPWLALALLIAALAIAGRALTIERAQVALLGAWPVALMVAVLLVVPGAPWQAGVAGLLGLTGVLLWPHALGRGRVERGLLIAFLPPTAGFSAIVAAAVATFDRATANPSLLSAAPWTGVTALLPVALAAGLLLGVRLARRAETEEFEPAAVIATWLVLGSAVGAGLWPRFAAPASAAPVFILHAVALSLGAIAARFAPKPRLPPSPPVAAPDFAPHALALPSALVGLATWAALLLAGATALALAWLTVRGLQVGFL